MTSGSRGRVARALLAAAGFYQRAVSPVLPPRCRFQPTCSAYAIEAVELHGAGRGSWLAARRLVKCAPWHPGGVDLVPPRTPSSSGTDRRPHRAPRPAPGRTPPQEAGVV
ncbi:membrane protein insertion efficiency factor YidD [Modestobacter lapidis]|nr:membrane protein insertion efficiency factor YidD [Modestobacter lapidis]